MKRECCADLIFILILLLSPHIIAAETPEEWSQWRGAARDGRVAGFSPPESWPGKLSELWRITVGEGHASPILHGGRLYVHAREGEAETVRCLDPDGGKEIWREARSMPYEMDPAAVSHGKGPKSTPAAADGRLFTLGISGTLSAFDSKSGSILWRKEFSKVYPRTSPLYGTAASPLVDRGLCIAHVGGHDRGALTAFDAATGEARWSWDGDGPGYASPIIADLAGKRQVVTETQTAIVGIEAGTGRLLWRVPLKTPYDQNAVTPVAWKDGLILSGLEQGIFAVELRAEGERLVPRERWRVQDVSAYMSTPVIAEGLLFGMSHKNKGQLFCMDPSAGKVHWTGEPGLGESAAIVVAGPVLIALTNGGELLYLEPSAKGPKFLARHQAGKTPTWAHPLVSGNRLWIKDRTTLAAFALE